MTRRNEDLRTQWSDMKKQQLEITLQKLRPVSRRSPKSEQYPTPSDIAADILWEAYTSGDVHRMRIADLGCGNGIFCIGARLLGASAAVGIDSDEAAIDTARSNAGSLGAEVEFIVGDVSNLMGRFDTVIQNPPFGAQKRYADRAFVKKALELAPTVYSLHNDGTQEFIGTLVKALGGTCEPVKRYKFEIPYAFEFHKKPSQSIAVILLRFKR